MKRQNVRTLSLIVFTFTYLLVGAAVFDAFESSYEISMSEMLHKEEKAWRSKYNINKQDYDNLTVLIVKMKPYKAGTQWKFAGSFYFATTVITTIGYGHSTPKTDGGKIFCMLYALPGIPLCIVMFQSIGERMNTLITSAIKCVKHLLRLQVPRQVSHTSLMFISSNIVVVVIISGAAVFKYYESWTYLDSFYYCFITLTTIGFGDFVALQRNDTLAKRPDYVAFSLIFILFGLTVVSSVMNLLVLRFLTMNTDDERRDEIQAAAAAVYAYDKVRSHNNSISNGMLDCNTNSNYISPIPFDDNHNPQEWWRVFTNYCSSCSFLLSFRRQNLPDSHHNSYKHRKRQRNNDNFNFRNYLCFQNTSVVFPATLISELGQPLRKRKRFTVIRDPAKVHHLAHSICSNTGNNIGKNSFRFHNSSKKWKYPPSNSGILAQENCPILLCPPLKSYINNQYSSQTSISSNNRQAYEAGYIIDDDDDVEDVLLDLSVLNSIKKTKRASI